MKIEFLTLMSSQGNPGAEAFLVNSTRTAGDTVEVIGWSVAGGFLSALTLEGQWLCSTSNDRGRNYYYLADEQWVDHEASMLEVGKSGLPNSLASILRTHSVA